MLTKTNFVFSLFLLTLCLFCACEEAEVVTPQTLPTPSIYAHMTGGFYTQRTDKEDYGYAAVFYSNRDTSDRNIQISVTNDTLTVLDYIFPINSVTQTSFSKSFGSIYNPEELKLDYYNNYDSIVLSHQRFSSTAGANPSFKVTYSGVRSSNKKRGGSGVYTLKVIHKEYAAQIDTTYTADLFVDVILNNYYSMKFIIESDELWCNSFFTYSKEHTTGSSGASTKIFYMQNDSLYIDYYSIENGVYAPMILFDTVYYSFQGVKK